MTADAQPDATGEELHALFRAVFALHRTAVSRMDAVHAAAGLGTPQVKVLDAFQRLGAGTVPDVAEDQGVSRQFVLTVCHELEAEGLIAFFDNPRHKRSRLASLTDAGREALNRFRAAEAALIGAALPRLDGAAVRAASALLAEIRDRIESEPMNLGS